MTEPHNLGKYQIIEEIGRGGFAVVYRALDTTLDREVALKVLKPKWDDDPKAVERFKHEACAASQLDHPGIATIYEVGQADGRLFIAMKLIKGQPLDLFIKSKGRLSWSQSLTLGRSAAEAVDYAHERGLIHRDIKPSNIVVDADDHVVLTDFGTVKAAQQASLTTGTTGNQMLGTAEYMPPEVWRNQSATKASDVYSLACVVYEMLTGRVLFADDSTPAVMTKHILDGPDLPEAWPQDVPSSVTAVLRRALARDPAERYTEARKFIDDLAACALENNTPVPVLAAIPLASQLADAPAAILPQAQAPAHLTMATPSSKPQNWKPVGAVGLIGLLAFGAVLILAGSSRPADTGTLPSAGDFVPGSTSLDTPAPIIEPTNTATSEPPTPAPTRTSFPTDTPAATATRWPTSTPRPSNTPTLRPTATRIVTRQAPATVPPRPPATSAGVTSNQPLNFSWSADARCWGRQQQLVTLNITAHGGKAPYDYYNDMTLIGQDVNGSVDYSMVTALGNQIPFKLIVVDSAGQKYMEDFFYKSGLKCV